MKKCLFITAAVLLSGCAPQKPINSVVTPAVQPAPIEQPQMLAPTPAPAAEGDTAVRIQECKKELAALKDFSPRSYEKYQAEFDAISFKTQKYIRVQDQLSDEINNLVKPKYQFAIRDFCFRVKNSLSTAIINQMK